MSNIHVAKMTEDGNYEVPVQILGAKSVEASFEVNEKSIFADNKAVWTAKSIASGSGTLELLGLTPDERRLLMGGEEAVGFGLTSKLNMPQFALLFEMEKADGKKVMYAIYNVSFNPQGISAVAVEDGIEEQTVSLEFSCLPHAEKDYFYYAVDTAESGADAIAQGFFTDVKFPA